MPPNSEKATRHLLAIPGTDIALPYTQIDGDAKGPTLLITGGVHGGEYPGIEAAIRFANALDPSRLRGRVYVIHLTNPPAFYGKSQYYVPLDGKNLNRVFPGSALGSVSERMAHRVSELARTSDFWVDMHGGDIHEALVPFTIYSDGGSPEVVAQSRQMAEAYGIARILESSSVAGGTYAFAATVGIPAILTESGQMGQLDEEAVQVHLRGLENILRAGKCGATMRVAMTTSPQIIQAHRGAPMRSFGFIRNRSLPNVPTATEANFASRSRSDDRGCVDLGVRQ